jgi:hypothetical protein
VRVCLLNLDRKNPYHERWRNQRAEERGSPPAPQRTARSEPAASAALMPPPGRSSGASRLRLETYLSEHSTFVALMVLEHQTLVYNRLAKARRCSGFLRHFGLPRYPYKSYS